MKSEGPSSTGNEPTEQREPEEWPAFTDDDRTPVFPRPPALPSASSNTPPSSSSFAMAHSCAPSSSTRAPSIRVLTPDAPSSLHGTKHRRRRAQTSGLWWYMGGVITTLALTAASRLDAPSMLRARSTGAQPSAQHTAVLPRSEALPAPSPEEPPAPSASALELGVIEIEGTHRAATTQHQEMDCEELVRRARAEQLAGRPIAAVAFFNQAMAKNPTYFPAALGLADAHWDRGQRDTAAHLYRNMLQQFPPAMIPARVRERSGER